MAKGITGAEALAYGAVESGVSFVSSYPGSPATAVVNKLLEMTLPSQVQIEWTSNEKVAIEMAFGASVGGTRSLLCVKSVGINIALDQLQVINLCGCNAGMVVLLGDDPGSWGSQNEQDSRSVVQAAQLPIIEPTTVSDAQLAVKEAFKISEEVSLPVVVRFTRALALGRSIKSIQKPGWNPAHKLYQSEFMQWVVLPVNAVQHHQRLYHRLEHIEAIFEKSDLNSTYGNGPLGIITCGFIYTKLVELLDHQVPDYVRILRLGTFHPLPQKLITRFVKSVEEVLVLEETTPLVEQSTRAAIQMAGITKTVLGRETDHVARVGEIFPAHIAETLKKINPNLVLPTDGEKQRPLPSQVSLKSYCPHAKIFDALTDLIAPSREQGDVIVVGEPGCMVRSQPDYKLMDVKTSLGASIGIAAGLSLSQTRKSESKKVIALSGDSSFLHSNFNGLVDAIQVAADLLVIIVDNQSTALTGGQSHPASLENARGKKKKAVQLDALVQAAGVDNVDVVDVDDTESLHNFIKMGLARQNVSVIIARGSCPTFDCR